MDSLMPLVWLLAFMLIPLWIPLSAIAFGALADLVQRRRGAIRSQHPALASAASRRLVVTESD